MGIIVLGSGRSVQIDKCNRVAMSSEVEAMPVELTRFHDTGPVGRHADRRVQTASHP